MNWRATRVCLAVCVALLLLGYVIASNSHEALQSCSDQLPDGQVGSIRVCEPVAATDAPVMLGVLLVALLLLPDFAEIAVPGLVSLKRRVETQEHRQERFEERLQAIAVSQSQSNNTQIILADEETFRASQDKVRRDVSHGDGGIPADDQREEEELEPPSAESTTEPGHSERDVDTESVEQALLASQLIRLAEDLAREAQLAEAIEARLAATVVTSSGASYSPGGRDLALLSWWRRYREELQLVRSARNTVAHGGRLDVDTLRGAVDLAQTLLDALPRDSSHMRPPGRDEFRWRHAQLVDKAREWLNAQGVRIDTTLTDGPRDRGFDLIGRADDRVVLVEMKIWSRRVHRGDLVSSTAQLEDRGRNYPGARLILIVSCPSATPEATDFARTAGRVEVYFETAHGFARELP